MEKRSKPTQEQLQSAVDQASTKAEVIRLLGWNNSTTGSGLYKALTSLLKAYAIKTNHFVGQAHAKGTVRENFRKYTDEELFVVDGPTLPSRERVVSLLKKNDVVYACSICSISTWLDQPITLHIDHKNGNDRDNRLENYRYLCPNCHQQTPTWGSKKLAKVVVKVDQRTAKAEIANATFVQSVLDADIDYSKYGWAKQVAQVLGKRTQHINAWMQRHMPNTYLTAFKRCPRGATD